MQRIFELASMARSPSASCGALAAPVLLLLCLGSACANSISNTTGNASPDATATARANGTTSGNGKPSSGKFVAILRRLRGLRRAGATLVAVATYGMPIAACMMFVCVPHVCTPEWHIAIAASCMICLYDAYRIMYDMPK